MNEKLIRLVLVEGLDDWTPIDRVISVVRECEEFDEEGIRDVVRDVLSALLERDLVTVGKIGSGGFESKSGPARDLVAEVVSDLDDCNWVPQGGSYWLANTAAADSLVADGSVQSGYENCNRIDGWAVQSRGGLSGGNRTGTYHQIFVATEQSIGVLLVDPAVVAGEEPTPIDPGPVDFAAENGRDVFEVDEGALG